MTPTLLTLITAILILYPSSAEAYLDPGAGSYILQMLLAGALGAIFTVKLYFQKIKSFFKDLLGKDKEDDEPDKT